MKTFKELTESIKTNIEEVDESLKPGWMLKKDPELAKKIKDKIDIAKKRQASHGDKSAGKSVNEEAEQIDELNKDTLSSYAKKAETQGNRLGDAYSKARIRKDAKDGQYAPDTKRMAAVDAKAKKRTDGAYAAQQKLNKEEAEQIDELNKDTLSSYRMAAHRDVNKKVDQKSKGEISNKDYEHGIKKRSKGITKADNKLGTYKNSRIDTSGNADSIKKFGTNEEVVSEK